MLRKINRIMSYRSAVQNTYWQCTGSLSMISSNLSMCFFLLRGLLKVTLQILHVLSMVSGKNKSLK